jgi:hypothetical protein
VSITCWGPGCKVLDSTGFVEPYGRGNSVEFSFQIAEREEIFCLSGINKSDVHVTVHRNYVLGNHTNVLLKIRILMLETR